jgi:hypothetical protein
VHVLEELFEKVGASHLTFALLVEGEARLADRIDGAEVAERLTASRIRIHAGRDESLDAHVDVKGQLLVDLLSEALGCTGKPKNTPHGQAGTGVTAASALLTARA